MVAMTTLVWRRTHARHHVALAEGLTYVVHKVAGTQRWHVSRNGKSVGDVVGNDVSDAKCLAQADYEKRGQVAVDTV